MAELNFDHLQNLAYLDLDPAQKERLQDQVGRILKHVANLSEVDTTGISPSFTVTDDGTPLRTDVRQIFSNVEALLANAPLAEGHAFRVPRIL